MNAIGEGGGKPDELVEEIVKVADSLIAYNEAYGIRPYQELIRRALANLNPRTSEQLGSAAKRAEMPEFKLYQSQPSGPLLIGDKAHARV